ncbi:MAG: iron-containing alcohol dehydrogenase, partial [Acidimicrobiales bacterium]
MTVVPVELGERAYEVRVGDGELVSLGALVRRRLPRARRAAVVTQAAIAAQPWFESVDPGVPFDVHTVADGEGAKSLATVESLCRAFACSGLARSDLVVAVGGGVVCDVAGFAAAIYHRGLAWYAVATSLLAQVDAAIGGKTGVNLPEGKNLAGAFWQPVGVACDTSTLATLPEREWVSGRGEVAKYALLADPGLAALALHEQVGRCVAFKASVVRGDEREG